jgi:predicted kinase
MDTPLLVVVTGPPAAGKSTLARPLADRLGLPLLTKDAVKESLHDSLGDGDLAWSRRLGVATFDVLFVVLGELLGAGVSVVAEANFNRADAFARLPPARVVQVHVSAPPDVLAERFRDRGERHPVHKDTHLDAEIAARAGAGEWEPLRLPGALIRVDASAPVDVDELAAATRRSASLSPSAPARPPSR